MKNVIVRDPQNSPSLNYPLDFDLLKHLTMNFLANCLNVYNVNVNDLVREHSGCYTFFLQPTIKNDVR